MKDHNVKARPLAPVAPAAQRNTPGVPISNPAALDAFAPPAGGRVVVSEQTALNLSAVWSAVRVISGAVSVIPLKVYAKGRDGEADEAGDSPWGRLIANPCPEMTPATFWETLTAHLLVWGNCYAEIEEDGFGNPIALWPLLPNQTRPIRDADKAIKYEAVGAGFRTVIPAANMLHIPGLGFDGLRGYSPVQIARRSLGLATTAEIAGESFFGGGMRPGGWVEYPGSLQALQKDNLEEGLKAKHGGAAKFGKALLLWGGMKYHELSINPGDAQFLETRQFQVVEVARWFDLPPHKIRDLSRATFSNIENQGIDFVTGSLMYWLNKIAQEWTRKLLRNAAGHYAEHLPEALLRGDTISRYTAYGLGRQWGFLSPNDIRRRENLKSIPGGGVYHVPVNMVPLGSEPRPDAVPPKEPPPGPDPTNATAARAVALDIAREVADYDADELGAAAESPAKLAAWCDEKARPGAWDWVAEVVPNRCASLTRTLGREVDPARVAAVFEAARLFGVSHVRNGVGGSNAAVVAGLWRSEVGEVADRIIAACGGGVA